MNSENKNETEKVIAANLAAIYEGKIKTRDILQEVLPFLKEFFIGDFELKKRHIEINFYNGQSFRLTVKELK